MDIIKTFLQIRKWNIIRIDVRIQHHTIGRIWGKNYAHCDICRPSGKCRGGLLLHTAFRINEKHRQRTAAGNTEYPETIRMSLRLFPFHSLFIILSRPVIRMMLMISSETFCSVMFPFIFL